MRIESHVSSIRRYVSSSLPASKIGGPAAIPLTFPVYLEKNPRQSSILFLISSMTIFERTVSLRLFSTTKYCLSLRASVSVLLNSALNFLSAFGSLENRSDNFSFSIMKSAKVCKSHSCCHNCSLFPKREFSRFHNLSLSDN